MSKVAPANSFRWLKEEWEESLSLSSHFTAVPVCFNDRTMLDDTSYKVCARDLQRAARRSPRVSPQDNGATTRIFHRMPQGVWLAPENARSGRKTRWERYV